MAIPLCHASLFLVLLLITYFGHFALRKKEKNHVECCQVLSAVDIFINIGAVVVIIAALTIKIVVIIAVVVVHSLNWSLCKAVPCLTPLLFCFRFFFFFVIFASRLSVCSLRPLVMAIRVKCQTIIYMRQ